MKIVELLNQNKDRLTFSFEFIPPSKGITSKEMLEELKPLMEFQPLFVDVTTHRHEIVFEDNNPKKGSYAKGFVHKKHPSTLAVCESIRNAFQVEVVPHLLCAGFSKTDTEDLLLDLHYLGYDNVIALRGDKLLTEHNYSHIPESNERTYDLIGQIKNLNRGIPLDSTLTNVSTDFCIGAACYPEKYYQNPSLDYEVYATKFYKKDADFLISQMGFNNKHFLKFKKLFNKPVLPGVKILTKFEQCFSIPSRFFVEIPRTLELSLKSEGKSAGVNWAILQCKDLIEKGCNHLHFYTMNSSLVCDVLKNIL